MTDKKTNWIIIAAAIIILIFIAVIYKSGQTPSKTVKQIDITSEEFLRQLTAPDNPNFKVDPGLINDLTAP